MSEKRKATHKMKFTIKTKSGRVDPEKRRGQEIYREVTQKV